jgi:hypothetical protein
MLLMFLLLLVALFLHGARAGTGVVVVALYYQSVVSKKEGHGKGKEGPQEQPGHGPVKSSGGQADAGMQAAGAQDAHDEEAAVATQPLLGTQQR